ncbi:type II toxin-antitoxin system VapB family antitoxin [Azospirillum sp. sgz301742]
MTLIINHPEADRLAQELASQMRERLIEIGKHCASLPVLDPRSPDEILGYDENGLPN